MSKAIQIIKSVLVVVGLFALGLLTGALLVRKKDVQKTADAEKAKEDKKNEIENTPAADLVSRADNTGRLRAEKDGFKSDFRERIRNRLASELHRLTGGAADSDCGTGSGRSD